MKKLFLLLILALLASLSANAEKRKEVYFIPNRPITLNVDTFYNKTLEEYVKNKLKPALLEANIGNEEKPMVLLNFYFEIDSAIVEEPLILEACLNMKYPYFLNKFEPHPSYTFGMIPDQEIDIYVLRDRDTKAVRNTGKKLKPRQWVINMVDLLAVNDAFIGMMFLVGKDYIKSLWEEQWELFNDYPPEKYLPTFKEDEAE